jgi:AcrR family transcriptional regulator
LKVLQSFLLFLRYFAIVIDAFAFMTFSIQIKLNNKLFLKDPQQSELGRRIVKHSIELLDQIGFEAFTFKKLAVVINSAEPSIYRYFENKHKLLLYLISWYWAWLEYQIDYNTHNIEDPFQKLKIIIKIIASSFRDESITHVDEELLHSIVIAESEKVFLTKQVDEENKEGFFANYKSLCNKISSIILEINPNYVYPMALANSLLEITHKQIFFIKHLPSLSEVKINEGNYDQLRDYIEHFVFNLIQSKEFIKQGK